MNDIKMAMFNEWVISYSPFLIQKYHIHINVEVIKTVQVCKYIYKYIYKNEDYITFCFNKINLNEIAEHLNECYIKLMQTAYQMLKYSWYKKNSSVTILNIHLSDEQSVYYKKNVTSEKIQQIRNQFNNMLIIFFKYCDKNADV